MGIERLKMCFSSLSDSFLIGYLNKKGNMFTQKVDITSEVYKCLLQMLDNNKSVSFNISANGVDKCKVTLQQVGINNE